MCFPINMTREKALRMWLTSAFGEHGAQITSLTGVAEVQLLRTSGDIIFQSNPKKMQLANIILEITLWHVEKFKA